MTATQESLVWDDVLALADAAPLCGLSAQTLKLQAERGRLQARKLAGRWVTTRRWLYSYLSDHGRKGRAGSCRARSPEAPPSSVGAHRCAPAYEPEEKM